LNIGHRRPEDFREARARLQVTRGVELIISVPNFG
jgi:hypothetical protein